MTLSGRTLITAIFGDPVEHTLSPAMHNAGYAALGMDRAYLAFQVRPNGLEAALRAIPALGIAGVNLTVPHKEAAARMLGQLSAEAKILGAVNCVVNRRGALFGDNTDARGLERDLRELKVGLGGDLAIVIGAGGGGAAAVLACARLGAARIVLANRTMKRALALGSRLSAHHAMRGKIEVRGLDALLDRTLLSRAALVINATSMGLKSRGFVPLRYEATPAACFFYDLLYAARPTAFLKAALRAERQASDGAGMLLYQAALAFRLFNRAAPPVEAMRRALMRELGR